MTKEDLKQFRARLGMTQPELAEALTISVRTLQDWEQGRFEPPGFLLLALKYLQIQRQAKKK